MEKPVIAQSMQETKRTLLGSDSFGIRKGKLNVPLEFHADFKVKISMLLHIKVDITN